MAKNPTIKGESFSVHHSNIQTLAIELHKVTHNLSNNIFKELFIIRNQNGPCLRSQNEFFRPQVRTVYKGIELAKSVWSNNIEYYSL